MGEKHWRVAWGEAEGVESGAEAEDWVDENYRSAAFLQAAFDWGTHAEHDYAFVVSDVG